MYICSWGIMAYYEINYLITFKAVKHDTYICVNIEIDEKGTLKATEHDNYENIAGSV
jgi:hypothetical protein